MEPFAILMILALAICLIVLSICSFVRLGRVHDEIEALRRAIGVRQGDRSSVPERGLPVIVAPGATIHAPTVVRPIPPLPDDRSASEVANTAKAVVADSGANKGGNARIAPVRDAN